MLTVLGVPSCWKSSFFLIFMQHFTESQAIFQTSAEERKKMVYWKTEVFCYLFPVWDPDSIPSSAWSNLHSCFPLPRRVPSLSGYSAFLGGICQTPLLNLIQLSQENPAFWLIHRGFTTCIKQVKTELHWKASILFPSLLSYCTLPSASVFGPGRAWRDVRPAS